MFIFVEKYLSLYMCWYRKGFSTQQVLLSWIETSKKVLDRKGYGRAVLLDISNAFNTIFYDLLLVKLHVYIWIY